MQMQGKDERRENNTAAAEEEETNTEVSNKLSFTLVPSSSSFFVHANPS